MILVETQAIARDCARSHERQGDRYEVVVILDAVRVGVERWRTSVELLKNWLAGGLR